MRPRGTEWVWSALHKIFNKLAWRYARPDGPEWGIATRIDKTRLLWRLNAWASDHYVPKMVNRHVEETWDSDNESEED